MLQPGAGTLAIREVYYGPLSDQIQNQTQARAAIDSPLAGATIKNYSAPVFNLFDSDAAANGHFFNQQSSFRVATEGPSTVGNTDFIALVVRGIVRIPAANPPAGNIYTFGFNSDDGFTLAFDNGASAFSGVTNASLETYNTKPNGAIQFHDGRGAADSFGQVALTPGDHPFVLTYHEGNGGSGGELFASKGAKTTFDSEFALVGGAASQAFKRSGTIAANGWTVKTVHGNNSQNLQQGIADINQAFANVAVTPRAGGTPLIATALSQTVNYHDPEGTNTGGHSPVQIYPGDVGGVDDNNFTFGARATLTIPAGQGGHYTFLTYSDDSSLTRILSGGVPVALLNTVNGIAGGLDSDGNGTKDSYTNDPFNADGSGGGCCGDILGTYNLPEGVYTLETVSNEQGGGAGHFLYGAFGDQTGFGPQFQLVGENLNETTTIAAGLELVAVPEPTTLGLFGIGAVAALARRRGRRA